VLGLCKFFSILHIQDSYKSVLSNLTDKLLILRLGSDKPYMKIGQLDYYDTSMMRLGHDGNPEAIVWANLIETGTFVLPLRHIAFIYRDEENEIIRTELVITDCIEQGCRGVFNTKSYYIYGPAGQINV
jgi:hypothetical protein